MALRKIKNVYYVYFRDERGRLTTRSLHVHDAAAARVLERRFMDMLRARKAMTMLRREFPEMAPAPAPLPVAAHRRGIIRLDAMFDVAARKRPLSKTHASAWERFWEWASARGLRFADEVTPQIAQTYLQEHYGGGNGKTYNNVRICLNTVFRCCLVEAHLETSPLASIVNRRVLNVETHRNLTEEEFSRLVAALPEDCRVLAMLSRWTAQRLETCLRITPEMFDFERLVFVIQPGKTRRFKKWVCVPIFPELEAFIRPLLPRCSPGVPIIASLAQRPVRNYVYSHYFVAAMRRLGIDDTDAGKASFHSIRGTAITWLKGHGVKGEDLRSVTGHASTAVEDIYARDIASLSRIAAAARCQNP